jgi:hypothetical protein
MTGYDGRLELPIVRCAGQPAAARCKLGSQ